MGHGEEGKNLEGKKEGKLRLGCNRQEKNKKNCRHLDLKAVCALMCLKESDMK